MIATGEPLQTAGVVADRALRTGSAAVKVLDCEARPLDPDAVPAEGAQLSLVRDPRRPFVSGAVLLLDEAGGAVAELPALPVRMLAALLDNGCHVFALVAGSGPRLRVSIHLAPPV
ncbi:hypothetical protein [Cereibacter sphaeroides]|uniref:hypothetical protein n=1 Tax=Cereibacter sphaeroides TaxID=1063 RepID=UPI001F3328F6|nr:hypothetical protein [Cereibacter sphaeroides]MCE6952478.1 hypothetical protein [Cereibacter sphaeroides]MCE6968622.1 hypothetical protein [Cereibacter sphaeroides]